MTTRRAFASSVLTFSLVAACTSPSVPPGTGGKPRPRPSEAPASSLVPGGGPGAGLAGALVPEPGKGGGLISNHGGGLVSDHGGGLVSDHGGAVVGKVKGPASLIGRTRGEGAGLIGRTRGEGADLIGRTRDDGAGLIGRTRYEGAGLSATLLRSGAFDLTVGGGRTRYALAMADDVPYAGLTVELRGADGQPLRDAAGKPISAVTGPDGGYRLPYPGGEKHAVVAAMLPESRGDMLALVPRGPFAEPRTIDADLASSLTMGYILERYVKGRPDPAAVLDRLPPELEGETRAALGAAAARGAAAPTTLAPAAVVDVVERLRTNDVAVDGRLAEVRRVLLAGLSDQGAGQPADTIEGDALDVAISPAGEIVFAGTNSERVWKKDAAGRLVPVAGSGLRPPGAAPGATDPAPGDGGPATAAYLVPTAVTYAPDGTLLILDTAAKRVRQVGADGIISTRVAHPDWDFLIDMVAEPDGGLVVATHSAGWGVPPDGPPTRFAGEVRPFDSTAWARLRPSGEGGKPADARFALITGISLDPATRDIYVADVFGQVFRLGADYVARVAGSDTIGATGDGGPATEASLGLSSTVLARADGSLVIADAQSRRIREVAGGVIRTIAGGGETRLTTGGAPALSAQLVEPRAPLRGPDGALYFCDQGYVRRLAGGQVTTVIGGTRDFDVPRPASEVQLLAPATLRYDAAADAMWIGDLRHVWRWTLGDDRIVSVLGAGPAGAPFHEGQPAREANLLFPRAFVPEGPDRWLVCVADPANNAGRVVRVASGAMTTVAGGGVQGKVSADGPALGATFPSSATGIDLLVHGGWHYYTVALSGRIRRFREGGSTEAWGGYGTSKADGTLAKDFDFARVNVLAEGPDGQFYVGDAGALYRIDPATTAVTRIAGTGTIGGGGDGGPAQDAQVGAVAAIAWDAAGHLYFSDADARVVRRIHKDTGVITRVAGAGTAAYGGNTVDTGLALPAGLAFDQAGDLYIADPRHGQIKVVPRAELPQ